MFYLVITPHYNRAPTYPTGIPVPAKFGPVPVSVAVDLAGTRPVPQQVFYYAGL